MNLAGHPASLRSGPLEGGSSSNVTEKSLFPFASIRVHSRLTHFLQVVLPPLFLPEALDLRD
jgi:hypothetical protein